MQSICTGVYISINLRSHHVCNQIAHMHCLVPCNPFAGVSASISVHVQHLCCPLLSNFLEIDLDQLVDIHHLHHHLQDCLLHDNTLPLQFVLMVVTSLMSFSIAFTIVDKKDHEVEDSVQTMLYLANFLESLFSFSHEPRSAPSSPGHRAQGCWRSCQERKQKPDLFHDSALRIFMLKSATFSFLL